VKKQRTFLHKILEGYFRKQQGRTNDMWDKMTHKIRKVAKKTLGEFRDFGIKDK